MPHDHRAPFSLGVGEGEVRVVGIFRVEMRIITVTKMFKYWRQITAVELGFGKEYQLSRELVCKMIHCFIIVRDIFNIP